MKKPITDFIRERFKMANENMNEISVIFKPLEDQDLPLFFSWVKKPHIARWWKSDTYEKFVEKYSPEKAAKNYVFPFIIYINKRPIGYIQ